MQTGRTGKAAVLLVARGAALLSVGLAAVVGGCDSGSNNVDNTGSNNGGNSGNAAGLQPAANFPTILLPRGYTIEKVASGLTYPTSVTWDDQGRMYVVEAGGQFVEEAPPSRILRIEANGQTTEVANLEARGIQDSAVGMTFYQGAFYISHRAADRTGAVSRVTLDGAVTPLLSGIIDAQSEHQPNDIRVGPDGRIYLCSGPAFNSAVAGIDNAPFINRSPQVRTTVGQDIVLNGLNFETPDFRTTDPSDKALTGGFVPFGTPTTPGQVIKGTNKPGGAILVFDPNNAEGTVRPYAWGLRNIIGIAWNRNGEMLGAVNGYDVRGSRPVNDNAEATYRIREGVWYGWPDFSATFDPVNDPRFDVPDALKVPTFLNGQPQGKQIGRLIDLAASNLRAPDKSLIFGTHEINSSPSEIDVAPDGFGSAAGSAFVAEWGDLAPETTPLQNSMPGYRVTVIPPGGGRAVPFIRNAQPGPASRQGAMGQGIERPFGVRFGPDGALYIVDYGVGRVNMAAIAQNKPPYEFPPATGAIWKVTRATSP